MVLTRSSRRMVSCTAAAVLLISGVAVGIALAPPSSAASGTVLFNQPFNDNTVDGSAGSVVLPASPTGTNAACLTAAGNATANPLASCATATDPQGSGELRLTSERGDPGRGGVFAKHERPYLSGPGRDLQLIPVRQGDPSGAEGSRSCWLLSIQPIRRRPASGTSGGSLGYSAKNSTSRRGLSYGYMGVGL